MTVCYFLLAGGCRAFQNTACHRAASPVSLQRFRPAFGRYHRLASSSATTPFDDMDEKKWTEGSLSDQIKHAFDVGATDGILKLANVSSTILPDTPPQELIYQCTQALPNKVMAAGAINGFLGACSQVENVEDGAKLAWDLLEAFNELSEAMDLYPDMVAFALTYNALVRSQDERFHVLAQLALERGERLGKRKGGSKKRRSLVRERNKRAAAANSNGGSHTPATDASETLKQVFDIQVLAETPHLVIVNKPSGMACWHKRTTSQGKITTARLNRMKKGMESSSAVDVSLVDALLVCNVPLSTLGLEGRGLVHRIDRGTSGCIILAKTNDMHASLVSDFFLRNCKKTYTAIVRTPPPTGDKVDPALDSLTEGDGGMIDLPVTGRPAKTMYQVTKRAGPYATLALETLTGRKHQVRVHCASGLGSPVVLDPNHDDIAVSEASSNNKFFKAMMESQRFFLHATGLAIPKRKLSVKVPLPEWWKEAVTALEEQQDEATAILADGGR